MITDPYSKNVRAAFAEPAHAGAIEGATQVLLEDQGVRIQLFAQIENGSIFRLRFRAYGCPHVIAAAETLCDAYEGRAISKLQQFSAAELMQSLAVPVEKSGRILVIEDAVRSLVAALQTTSESITEQN